MACARALPAIAPPRHRPRASRIAPAFPSAECEAFEDRERAQARVTHHPISMSTEIAPASTASEPAAQKKERKPRISKRLRQAVELLASGKAKTQRDAAATVGMSEEHLCRSLRKSQIQAFMAQRAAENIARGVFRASSRFVDLIDAESEHVAAKVSERLLEHGGLLRAREGGGVNVSIINNVSPGYVIDLSGQDDGKMIDAEPATIEALVDRPK